MAGRHRHEYSALWSHYGQYGPQDVHLHYCVGDDCDAVLIGDTRKCEGKAQRHRRTTLEKELERRSA